MKGSSSVAKWVLWQESENDKPRWSCWRQLIENVNKARSQLPDVTWPLRWLLKCVEVIPFILIPPDLFQGTAPTFQGARPGIRRKKSRPTFSSDEESDEEYYNFLVQEDLRRRQRRGRGRRPSPQAKGLKESLCDKFISGLRNLTSDFLVPLPTEDRLVCQEFEAKYDNFHFGFGFDAEEDPGGGGEPLAYERMTRGTGFNVATVAIGSRLIVLALEVFASSYMWDWRHESDGFKFIPEEEGHGTKAWDDVVNTTFRGFTNWDGQYFLHIATKGYTEENMIAFFPLFPLTVGYSARILYIFFGNWISFTSLCLVLGWMLNTILFKKIAEMLCDCVKLFDQNFDPTSVILLFCFNPASIFFSSFYTESMFMFLTMKVILNLFEGEPYYALSWASMGALCRSNGLLNFGFVGAFFAHLAYQRYSGSGETYKFVARELFLRAMSCVPFLLPFIMFQAYGIMKFCTLEASKLTEFASLEELTAFESLEELTALEELTEFESLEELTVFESLEEAYPLPPYCYYSRLPYAYVQEKYWNVGRFRYFEIKQIPNFLLAAPILYFTFSTSWKRFWPLAGRFIFVPRCPDIFNLYVEIHGLFLSVFCFVFIHVQVSTRLILSAFPHLYFQIIETSQDEVAAFRNRSRQWMPKTTFIQVWCFTYFVVGTIAFSLGFPWT